MLFGEERDGKVGSVSQLRDKTVCLLSLLNLTEYFGYDQKCTILVKTYGLLVVQVKECG